MKRSERVLDFVVRLRNTHVRAAEQSIGVEDIKRNFQVAEALLAVEMLIESSFDLEEQLEFAED